MRNFVSSCKGKMEREADFGLSFPFAHANNNKNKCFSFSDLARSVSSLRTKYLVPISNKKLTSETQCRGRSNDGRREENGNKISIWILTTLTSTPGISRWKSPFPQFPTSLELVHPHTGTNIKWTWWWWGHGKEKRNNPRYIRLLCQRERDTRRPVHFVSIIDPSTFFSTYFSFSLGLEGKKQQQQSFTVLFTYSPVYL